MQIQPAWLAEEARAAAQLLRLPSNPNARSRRGACENVFGLIGGSAVLGAGCQTSDQRTSVDHPDVTRPRRIGANVIEHPTSGTVNAQSAHFRRWHHRSSGSGTINALGFCQSTWTINQPADWPSAEQGICRLKFRLPLGKLSLRPKVAPTSSAGKAEGSQVRGPWKRV